MESELTSPATRRNLHPAEIDCKWWKQGYCYRGSTCYFRHNPVLAGSDKPKNKANQVKIVQPDSQEQCAICLDTPKVFGLLVNCDHVFCLGLLFPAWLFAAVFLALTNVSYSQNVSEAGEPLLSAPHPATGSIRAAIVIV